MAGSAPSADLAVKSQVSDAEWRARVDLAALYRLVALNGWTDLIFTHISMRVPGPETHFLINPFGALFEEITASSLVKVDLDGRIVSPWPAFINPAGFTLHSAIHAARADAHCILHTHTPHGVAVSAQRDGLLPLSQHALVVLPQVAYHDYEGIALNLGERERIVRDLGDKRLMILRNHGLLSIGASAADTFLGMFFLERACTQQILALAGNESVLTAPKQAQEEVRGQMLAGEFSAAGMLVWQGMLRKLAREAPGYDA